MTEHRDKAEELEMQRQIHLLLHGFPAARENLIAILQTVQFKFGYISAMAFSEIASFLALPPGEVFGVATVYSQFRFSPPGNTPSGFAWEQPVT
jgi:NADH:ubiquinone oxidoreductase subunit E